VNRNLRSKIPFTKTPIHYLFASEDCTSFLTNCWVKSSWKLHFTIRIIKHSIRSHSRLKTEVTAIENTYIHCFSWCVSGSSWRWICSQWYADWTNWKSRSSSKYIRTSELLYMHVYVYSTISTKVVNTIFPSLQSLTCAPEFISRNTGFIFTLSEVNFYCINFYCILGFVCCCWYFWCYSAFGWHER
jgi:hypothetical protein